MVALVNTSQSLLVLFGAMQLTLLFIKLHFNTAMNAETSGPSLNTDRV